MIVDIMGHKLRLQIALCAKSVAIIRQNKPDAGDQHIRAGRLRMRRNGKDFHTTRLRNTGLIQFGQYDRQSNPSAGADVQEIDIELQNTAGVLQGQIARIELHEVVAGVYGDIYGDRTQILASGRCTIDKYCRIGKAHHISF